MNRICIAALMTVMICGSGCGPSEREIEATEKLLSAWDKDIIKSTTVDYIRLLISEGADVNASNKDGGTPLMYAANYSSTTEIVTLLIEAGADVNARHHNDGWTVLFFSKTPEIVTLLIEAGANVNAKSKNGTTPLMVAASRPRFAMTPEIVTLLIEAGADVDAKNNDGQTPLMYAKPEIIKLLKAAGAKE